MQSPDVTLILLSEQGAGREARHLVLTELRAASPVDEPVEPASARQIPVGAGSGLVIEGRWVEQAGQLVWERGTMLRLIVEQGDLGFQLQADPRDDWDPERLAAVAASLR